MTRFNTVLRRRRRLTVALVAALALVPAAAEARPAKWSAPASPAKWSASSSWGEGGPAMHTNRSSWT